jgi:hypothetical protein
MVFLRGSVGRAHARNDDPDRLKQLLYERNERTVRR